MNPSSSRALHVIGLVVDTTTLRRRCTSPHEHGIWTQPLSPSSSRVAMNTHSGQSTCGTLPASPNLYGLPRTSQGATRSPPLDSHGVELENHVKVFDSSAACTRSMLMLYRHFVVCAGVVDCYDFLFCVFLIKLHLLLRYDVGTRAHIMATARLWVKVETGRRLAPSGAHTVGVIFCAKVHALKVNRSTAFGSVAIEDAPALAKCVSDLTVDGYELSISDALRDEMKGLTVRVSVSRRGGAGQRYLKAAEPMFEYVDAKVKALNEKLLKACVSRVALLKLLAAAATQKPAPQPAPLASAPAAKRVRTSPSVLASMRSKRVMCISVRSTTCVVSLSGTFTAKCPTDIVLLDASDTPSDLKVTYHAIKSLVMATIELPGKSACARKGILPGEYKFSTSDRPSHRIGHLACVAYVPDG